VLPGRQLVLPLRAEANGVEACGRWLAGRGRTDPASVCYLSVMGLSYWPADDRRIDARTAVRARILVHRSSLAEAVSHDCRTRPLGLSEVTTTIASAVEEQGTATKEISRNVAMAAQSTEELSANVAAVTDAIGQTSAQSATVLTASGALAEAARRLSVSIDDFLQESRPPSVPSGNVWQQPSTDLIPCGQ
jgi:hypothetical protein